MAEMRCGELFCMAEMAGVKEECTPAEMIEIMSNAENATSETESFIKRAEENMPYCQLKKQLAIAIARAREKNNVRK